MFDDPPPPAKKGDFKSLIIVTEFELEGVASIGVDMFVVFPEMEDSVETGLARFRVYVPTFFDLDFAIAIVEEEEGGLA